MPYNLLVICTQAMSMLNFSQRFKGCLYILTLQLLKRIALCIFSEIASYWIAPDLSAKLLLAKVWRQLRGEYIFQGVTAKKNF